MNRRLWVVIMGALLLFASGGCGNDPDERSQSTVADKPEPASQVPSTPRPESPRSRMVACIEGVGFKVSHTNQPAATATNYTVKSPNGTSHAVVIIHATATKAERSAAVGRQEDGLDDVAIGRVELVAYGDDDLRHRVIASCIADEYE